MADNLLSHLFASKDLSIIILTEERDMCLERIFHGLQFRI